MSDFCESDHGRCHRQFTGLTDHQNIDENALFDQGGTGLPDCAAAEAEAREPGEKVRTLELRNDNLTLF